MSQESPSRLSESQRRARIEAVSTGLRRFGIIDDFGLTTLFLRDTAPHFGEVVATLVGGIARGITGVPLDHIARVVYRAVAVHDGELKLEVADTVVPVSITGTPRTTGGVLSIVELCLDRFQFVIREQQGHSLIQGIEARAQVLFNIIASDVAAAHDVDLSPEVETGRGPVDFKAAAGARARVLIEMKRVSHTAFWEGLRSQLPTYLRASDISAGYFVPIVQDGDSDLDLDAVERVAAELGEAHQLSIRVKPIDARKPSSASKVRSSTRRG